MKRHWFFVVLLCLISAVMLRAFIPAGYFKTHDGDFHLVRLDHYVKELQRGQFPVRLGTELAEGYGYPAFNYFYPLPYLAGAVFRLAGLPLGESLKLVMIVSTVGSGLACYWWLLRHGGRFAAFVGACLYLLAPYRLVSLFVTGQIGTISAFLWMPLILAGTYDVLVKNQRRWSLGLVAISVAGLVLSHINTLILFAPILALYLVLLGVKHRPSRSSWTWLAISLGLGSGLAAFYLLPSLLEKSWVRMGNTVFVTYTEHWPTFKQLLYSPWGYGYSSVGVNDGMSFQIGMAQWLVIGLSTIVVVWQLLRHRGKFDSKLLLPTLTLFSIGGMVFLMLPISEPLWQLLFPMQYLQYPWRWLSSLVLLTSFLSAWLTDRRIGKGLGIGLLLITAFNVRNYLRTWESIRYPDEFYTQNSTFYHGSTDISWEALPVGVPLRMIPQGPATSLIATQSASQTVINKFYLPLWQVKVDGVKVATRANEDGLLTIDQLATVDQLELSVVQTPLEQTANAVSLLSIALIVLLGITNWSEQLTLSHSPVNSSPSSAPLHRERGSKKQL